MCSRIDRFHPKLFVDMFCVVSEKSSKLSRDTRKGKGSEKPSGAMRMHRSITGDLLNGSQSEQRAVPSIHSVHPHARFII